MYHYVNKGFSHTNWNFICHTYLSFTFMTCSIYLVHSASSNDSKNSFTSYLHSKNDKLTFSFLIWSFILGLISKNLVEYITKYIEVNQNLILFFSTCQLKILLLLHINPINVVICKKLLLNLIFCLSGPLQSAVRKTFLCLCCFLFSKN